MCQRFIKDFAEKVIENIEKQKYILFHDSYRIYRDEPEIASILILNSIDDCIKYIVDFTYIMYGENYSKDDKILIKNHLIKGNLFNIINDIGDDIGNWDCFRLFNYESLLTFEIPYYDNSNTIENIRKQK